MPLESFTSPPLPLPNDEETTSLVSRIVSLFEMFGEFNCSVQDHNLYRQRLTAAKGCISATRNGFHSQFATLGVQRAQAELKNAIGKKLDHSGEAHSQEISELQYAEEAFKAKSTQYLLQV